MKWRMMLTTEPRNLRTHGEVHELLSTRLLDSYFSMEVLGEHVQRKYSEQKLVRDARPCGFWCLLAVMLSAVSVMHRLLFVVAPTK